VLQYLQILSRNPDIYAMIELQERMSGCVIIGMVRSLLEALADYGSIYLANKHLFIILKDIAIIAQAGGKKGKAQFQELQQEMQSVTCPIKLLLAGKIGRCILV
jgi:hypothetical protein